MIPNLPAEITLSILQHIDDTDDRASLVSVCRTNSKLRDSAFLSVLRSHITIDLNRYPKYGGLSNIPKSELPFVRTLEIEARRIMNQEAVLETLRWLHCHNENFNASYDCIKNATRDPWDSTYAPAIKKILEACSPYVTCIRFKGAVNMKKTEKFWTDPEEYNHWHGLDDDDLEYMGVDKTARFVDVDDELWGKLRDEVEQMLGRHVMELVSTYDWPVLRRLDAAEWNSGELVELKNLSTNMKRFAEDFKFCVPEREQSGGMIQEVILDVEGEPLGHWIQEEGIEVSSFSDFNFLRNVVKLQVNMPGGKDFRTLKFAPDCLPKNLSDLSLSGVAMIGFAKALPGAPQLRWLKLHDVALLRPSRWPKRLNPYRPVPDYNLWEEVFVSLGRDVRVGFMSLYYHEHFQDDGEPCVACRRAGEEPLLWTMREGDIRSLDALIGVTGGMVTLIREIGGASIMDSKLQIRVMSPCNHED